MSQVIVVLIIFHARNEVDVFPAHPRVHLRPVRYWLLDAIQELAEDRLLRPFVYLVRIGPDLNFHFSSTSADGCNHIRTFAKLLCRHKFHLETCPDNRDADHLCIVRKLRGCKEAQALRVSLSMAFRAKSGKVLRSVIPGTASRFPKTYMVHFGRRPAATNTGITISFENLISSFPPAIL